jgi:urease alpha subunit
VKPELVLKGGCIAYVQMGDPNASIPTPEPVFPRPMFGAYGAATAATSLTFVSRAAADDGLGESLGFAKRLAPVRGARSARGT